MNAKKVVSVLGVGTVVLLGLFGQQRSSSVELEPGKVISVSDYLDTPHGGRDGEGEVSLPTVRGTRVPHFRAWWCQLADGCDLRDLDELTSSGNTAQAAEESVVAADQAATLYAAEHLRPDDRSGPEPVTTTYVGDVRGPSGGLAMGLFLLDVRTEGDLVGESTIVATGTLDAAGDVGEVGGVAYKTVSAVEHGADALLVPAGDVEDAQPHEDVEVVPVATLDEAVTWLCENGGTGPLCDR